jgi:hypothetical protein
MHNIYSLLIFTVDLVGVIKEVFDNTRMHGIEYFLIDQFLPSLIVSSQVFQLSSLVWSIIQHYFWYPVVGGSEMYSVNSPTQNPSSSAQIPSHSVITVPSFAEEMLQSAPVQRLEGGNPTTVLPSSRLVTHPRDLSVTSKLQCKDNRTANLTTKYFKETVKQYLFSVHPKFLSWKVYGHVL